MAFFATALVAACSGSGNHGEDLIGTWGGSTFSMTFNADGNVVFVGDGGVDNGTWEADGDRLTLVGLGVEVGSTTIGYVIHDDVLVLGALQPDGATDGVIGTWRGEVTEDDEIVETTVELEASGTGHITAIASAPSEAIDADLSWELVGPRLMLDWDNPDGSSTTRIHFVIPDVAFGGLLLPRAEPGP